MRLPARRTARMRLALVYSGLFLLLGTAVIIVILVAVRSAPTVQVAVAVPQSAGFQAHPIGPGSSNGPTASITPGAAQAVVSQHSADVSRLLAVSWVVLALTALISIPLGWFASGRMLRPLREMTVRARTITAGNLHERLAPAGPADEFKQLGDTLDELLARLEASFEAQRRFVANASHELRTPLTVERTLIQVALTDPTASAATLRATCEELLAAGREQERLLDAMLTLARSEQGLEQREPIDLALVAGRVLSQPRPETQASGINVEAKLEPASIVGDPALIERLIANLVDNAVQHNLPGGSVEVRTGIDEGRPLVSVANSGVVIAPGEIEVLFEPFRRLGQQRIGAGTGRHGLGLSIVRAIAIAHGGSVGAQPLRGGGLLVSVTFPGVELSAIGRGKLVS